MKFLLSLLSFSLFSFCFSEAEQSLFVTSDCLDGTYSTISAGYRGNRGMGYEDGYSTISLFVTPSWTNEVQPLLDARFHVFNSGYYAANLGGGLRFGTAKEWGIFGVNAFYDYRKWKSLESNQFGAGLELLTKIFSARLNGYYPISSKFKETGVSFLRFQGNSILFQQSCRFALPSADFEIAASNFSDWKYVDFYLALGPYYLFKQNGIPGSVGNHLGGKAKFEILTKWVRIGTEYTYDRLFKSRIVGYASLVVPLGKREKKLRWYGAMKSDNEWCKPYRNQMAVKTQPIQRNEIIPMKNKNFEIDHRDIFNAFQSINNAIYVNNDGRPIGLGTTTSGNGTFENPFTTLAQAEANSTINDLIYLDSGNQTTDGYDAGIVLKTGQYLVGSGKDFTFGTVVIPAATPGIDPKITNTNGVGITLARNATVSGVDVINPTEDCLYASNISGFTVQYCTLENSGFGTHSGLNANGTTGGFKILNNIINVGNASGIQLDNCQNVDSKSQIFISNNTITGNVPAVDSDNNSIALGPDVFINNNTINAESLLRVTNNYCGSHSYYAKGNSFTGDQSIGIQAIDQDFLSLSLINNVLNNASLDGFVINVEGECQGTTLSFIGNTFEGTSANPFSIYINPDLIDKPDFYSDVLLSQNTFVGFQTLNLVASSGGAAQQSKVIVANNINIPQATYDPSSPTYTLYNQSSTTTPQFQLIGNTIQPRDFSILLGELSNRTWNLYVTKNSTSASINPYVNSSVTGLPINFVSPTSKTAFTQQNTNMGTAHFGDVTFNP